MQKRLVGPALDHRIRIAHPEAIGDERLRIQAYGVRELISPIIIDRPQGTDDWLLMAFHGPARVWVESSGMVEVPGDSLVVWRPHAPHRFGHDRRTWLHSWLHADGELLRACLGGGVLPLDRPVPGIPARFLDRCLLLMHDELSAHAVPDPGILGNHLRTWVAEVERDAGGGAAAPQSLIAVRTAIQARYAEPLTLQDFADIAGCSRQHLCATFRQWFGTTPIDLLLRVRLQHAWLLLQDRRRGVAEVATLVGFNDYRNFSRLYKRRFGTPGRRGGAAYSQRAPFGAPATDA